MQRSDNTPARDSTLLPTGFFVPAALVLAANTDAPLDLTPAAIGGGTALALRIYSTVDVIHGPAALAAADLANYPPELGGQPAWINVNGAASWHFLAAAVGTIKVEIRTVS